MNTPASSLRRRLLLGTLALAAIGSCPQKALAQTFNWAVDGGATWSADTSWNPVVVGEWPKDAGDIANLNFNLTTPAAITLDAPITLGALTIGDTNATNSYTLSDGVGGSLTFDNSGDPATLTESATGLSDTVAATLRTAGDLNIVNLNTTSGRTFTLLGPLASSAVAGTQTVTFSQASANAAVVMTGVISNGVTGGTIALSKTGSGALTLGATNSYTGGTTLSAGTITGNAAGALTGTFTHTGGTLRINNYAAAATVDTATGVTENISGGTLTFGTNASATFALGAINLTASAAINAQSVSGTAAANSIATVAAPLNVSGNPTLTSSSGTNLTVTMAGLTTLNSDLTVSNSTTTFRLSAMQEDATPRKITKIGGGTSVLDMLGVANYSGGTNVLAGVMQFSTTGASGSGLIQIGDVSGTSAAEVRAGGGVTVANDITVRSGSTGTMKIAHDTTSAGTATYSGLITLQKATTFEDVSTAGSGSAPLEITGKITGADVKITTNARTGSTNQIIRFRNAANDFGFAAATPDAITHNGGILLVQSDLALGAAGNGITLINTNGSLRAEGTFSTARTLTSNVAAGSAAGIDVTAGNELTLTAAGQLLGTGGLNKTGNTGVLTITGDNNARTTGTTITTGTIRINSSANIGTASPVTLSGGIFDLRNDASTVFTNNVTVTASSTVNVDQAVGGAGAGNTHTIGTISIGANTLTLTNAAGVNNYSLATGAVTATANATFTNSLAGTGTLTIPSIAYNSASAGTVTLGGVGTTTVTGGLSSLGAGPLAVTKAGTGTATIAAASSYTGVTTITGGTLRATLATSLGSGGNVTLGAATLAMANDASTNYGYNISVTGTGFINADRALGGVGTGNKHTIGTITLTTQTLTFNGGNDYSIDTGAVNVGDNGTLTNNLPGAGVLTIASIAANNAAAKTLTLRGTGNTVVAGPITQAGAGVYSLVKNDAGTATLNGVTTITGNVNIGNTTTNGGTLKLGVAGAIPNTILTVLSGTLDMNGIALNPTSVVMGGGPTLTSANIHTNGATLTLGGNVTYNSTGGFLGAFINGSVSLGDATRTFTTADTTATDPDLTINGAISDATGGLTKAGGGQLALTGTTANTWAGATTITNGSIQLGKTPGVNAVPGDVSITPSGGSFHSVLKWLASNQVPDTAIITMTGTAGVGGGNMDLNGFDETIAGLVWNNNQGTGSQIIRTGAGTLTVNSDITIAGSSAATTTSAPFGAAYVGNQIDGNLNLGGAVRTIDISATGNAVFSAAISNGGIIKTGGSRLTLSGATANTFTGDTTVSVGTLLLAKPAGVTAIIGNVLVNGGSVFYQDQRNDQIADTASVTLDFGTFAFAPGTTGNGNASETLANFTMNGGTFRTAVGTPAGGHSQIVFTGTFTLANGDFAVNSFSSLSANKFILNGGTNVIGGNATVEVNTLSIGAGGLEVTGGQMKMNLSTNAAALGSRIVLDGNVTSFASFNEAGFYGESAAGTFGTRTIEIGAGARTFNIAEGDALNDFRIDFDITGAGPLVKAGDGTLALNGLIGTGTTSLTANGGVVAIAQSQTLAALVIGNGATVILNEDLLPAPGGFGGDDGMVGGGPLDDFGAPLEIAAATGEFASVAAVPEPGALGLLGAGLLGLLSRRRRR